MPALPGKRVAVVGGGPSGMTAALLLARAGHRIVIFEHEKELGGLWAANLDSDGYFLGENSCKVYQSTYHSAPALFRMLGTEWAAHFTERHDLGSHWLAPFVADSSWLDLAKLGGGIRGSARAHAITPPPTWRASFGKTKGWSIRRFPSPSRRTFMGCPTPPKSSGTGTSASSRAAPRSTSPRA